MPTNVVLTEFKGDATSFLAAVTQMTNALNQLNTQLNNVNNSNAKVAQTNNNVATSQQKVSASTIAMGNIISTVALKAFHAVKDLGSSFADTGVHVRKLQEVMGGSAEDMSKLIAVAGAYKIPFDALVVSYRTFAIQAVSNTKAFRDLGLSMRDQNGVLKDSITMFGEAADKLNAIGNDTQRTAAAGVLFGRRYKELLPILALGSEGMKKVAENASKLGIVLDEQGVKKAVEYTQAQTQFHQSLQGLSFTIMKEVVPSLTTLFRWFTLLIVNVKDYMATHGGLIKNIKLIAAAFFTLWGTIKAVTIIQSILTGASTLGAIGNLVAKMAVYFATTIAGYGGVAAAASAAAAAELSAWAATGVGLLVVGGAVAGAMVLIDKLMSKIGSVGKLDLPKFTGFAGGPDEYIPTTDTGGKKDKKKTALEQRLKAAKDHLKVVKDYWDAQVDAAKKALDITKKKAEEYQSYIKSIADVVKESAEIPGLITESFAQYLGPSNLVLAFQRKLQDAKDFLSALTTLRDGGLSPDILGQLAAAGPQAGLQAAKVILSDMSVISQLNDLQAQLVSYAGKIGTLAGGYVMPGQQGAAGSLESEQAAYDTLVGQQAAAVGKAERGVSRAQTNINVYVNAQTNANPAQIAKDVAFAIQTGGSAMRTVYR